MASRDVSEVSIRSAGGGRIPATLHDLEVIGLDAQAFFALIPAAADPVAVVALDAEGGEVGRATCLSLSAEARQPPDTTSSDSRSRPPVSLESR